MPEWYYAPWQYELRERLPTSSLGGARRAAEIARRLKVPTPALGAGLGIGYFLAYTPLLQPGPPGKLPTEGTFPIYQIGGRIV